MEFNMTITAPVIRCQGAKFRLAPWVLQHFPPHTCYIESFGAAAGVLMQKPRSYAEVYNDLDGDIVNLFRVLQDPVTRSGLTERLVFTLYSREEFKLSWEPSAEPVERARRTIIRAQMGFGLAGPTKGVTGFRIHTKRQYGTAQSLWATYPEQLAEVGQRLSGVLIENRPAIKVITAGRTHCTTSTRHMCTTPDTKAHRAAVTTSTKWTTRSTANCWAFCSS
jgi:DNA adenine methylase